MMGVDDEGRSFELAPDPLVPEMNERLSTVVFGQPETLKDQLKGLLSNESLFFIDLYKAGIGERIEEIFREEIAGPGALRKTLVKYLG